VKIDAKTLKILASWEWWYIPVIPATGEVLLPEDSETKVSAEKNY
jgi:hypothetical protein